MSSILQPRVTATLVAANSQVSNEAQKILIVNQMASDGTATSGVLYKDVLLSDYNTLFGRRSIISNMLRTMTNVFNLALSKIRIDVIPLDDPTSGTQFESDILFTGPATEAGTLTFIIGSEYDNKYEIDVANTDSAADIATSLVAAITADINAPFTATLSTATAQIKSVHKGTIGNNLTVKMDGTVAGVTYTNTETAGTGSPVLTNVFDVIGITRYQRIVWSDKFDLDTVVDFLKARFNTTNSIQDGVAVITTSDTLSNLITLGNSYNTQVLTILNGGLLQTGANFKGSLIVEISEKTSACFAAYCAIKLTENANLTSFITASITSTDSLGGMHMASFPYFNTLMLNHIPCNTNLYWSQDEQDQLAAAGITLFGNDENNLNVILSTTLTTYKTDISGNPNNSFKFLEYLDTEVTCRETYVVQTRSTFRQTRLTQGDTLPGYSMANSQLISSFVDGVFNYLGQKTLVLIGTLPNGLSAAKFFKTNRKVTIDYASGKATISMLLPIVTQLREMDYYIQVTFNI
jgi:phage tail sheath gpL-like